MTTTTVQPTLTGTYVVDPVHTRIGFVARHAMVTKVRGSFGELEGSGHLDADDPSRSRLELTIHTDSIDTGNPDRDQHLRSNDFFDMDRYPLITFASTEVEPLGDDRYRLTGELTIKAVTKPVTFELAFTGAATDPYGNDRIGFEGSTTVNRKDWGVSWNAALEAGGVLVSDKVTLEFDVSAIRSKSD